MGLFSRKKKAKAGGRKKTKPAAKVQAAAESGPDWKDRPECSGNEQYSPAQIIEAIHDSGGVKSVIASRLGTTRRMIRIWLEKYPEVRAAYDSDKSRMLDVAECELFNNIKSGDPASIFFFLKTQGKKRGYIERTETISAGILGIQNMSTPELKKKLETYMIDDEEFPEFEYKPDDSSKTD